jgi:TPR repeat protein
MNAGLMLAKGQGAPQDPVEACKWFQLAAAQGHAGAARNRELLVEGLSPEQIAEAQQRAALFVARREPGLQPGGFLPAASRG